MKPIKQDEGIEVNPTRQKYQFEKIWVESWRNPGQVTKSVERVRSLAESIMLAQNPESADMILFVDVENISGRCLHPLYRSFQERCYCYSVQIAPYGLLPGSYTGMCTWRNFLGRYVNFGYLGQETVMERVPSGVLDFDAPALYLFSFMGGSTSWVRKRLYKLRFNRDDILIEDTSSFRNWSRSQEANKEGRIRYYQTILSSKFVLCPKGAAPSSIRLYEVMELGRVPVIISDGWVRNPLVDWELFAVFVKESDIGKLEFILSSLEDKAEEMGLSARAAWEMHFAPERQFEGLIDCLSFIQRNRKLQEQWVRPFWPIMTTAVSFGLSLRKLLRKLILSGFRLFRLRFPYSLNRDN